METAPLSTAEQQSTKDESRRETGMPPELTKAIAPPVLSVAMLANSTYRAATSETPPQRAVIGPIIVFAETEFNTIVL
jgi:hypothetical protein